FGTVSADADEETGLFRLWRRTTGPGRAVLVAVNTGDTEVRAEVGLEGEVEVVFTTGDGVTVEGGVLVLPPGAGALARA
ncbi:DUF3459 domain-containing protein, partial [Nocardioides sp.]|uniref:DUF3459 domain-containing protein n=1 Tax=Nocardioides sp. TaxID=35761 RepID=UPI002736FB0A